MIDLLARVVVQGRPGRVWGRFVQADEAVDVRFDDGSILIGVPVRDLTEIGAIELRRGETPLGDLALRCAPSVAKAA